MIPEELQIFIAGASFKTFHRAVLFCHIFDLQRFTVHETLLAKYFKLYTDNGL
jgi:hypothetical protein